MTESASGTPNLSPAASEGSAMGTRSLFIGEFPTSIFGVRRHSAHVEVYIPLLITSLHNKICRSELVERWSQWRSIPGSIRSFAVVKFLPVFRTYEEVFFLLWLQAKHRFSALEAALPGLYPSVGQTNEQPSDNTLE